MGPVLAREDHANQGRAYTEAFGNFSVSFPVSTQTANFEDALFGQLRHSMTTAEHLHCSALGLPVGHVVVVGSKEQVVDTNAGWIVASVQDQRISRVFSVANLPGKAMRTNAPLTYAHSAIADPCLFLVRPLPATGGGEVNLGEESVNQFFCKHPNSLREVDSDFHKGMI